MSRFKGTWTSLNFYKAYLFGFETLVGMGIVYILSIPLIDTGTYRYYFVQKYMMWKAVEKLLKVILLLLNFIKCIKVQLLYII